MAEKEVPAQMAEHLDTAQDLKSKTIDTVHNDEAMRVLATYTGDEAWTEAEENKLRCKIDWKLMPVLCITYGLQYYDKAMLSQAVCHPKASSYYIGLDIDRIGLVWIANRLRFACWRSLRLVSLDILSGIYPWCLPSNDLSPEISCRTRCFRYCYTLGPHSYLDMCLYKLPRFICTKILPRPPRERYQPHVYAHRCKFDLVLSHVLLLYLLCLSNTRSRDLGIKKPNKLCEWESGTAVLDTSRLYPP
jgi:hypothetical protein